MVRPVTILCATAAVWSGLYLYQAKHASQLLDRQIEKTVRDSEQVREQTRLLHAEWMLLNDPERLRQFAKKYLSLKPVDPKQFTSLADLQNRLPAPRGPEPAPAVDSVAIEQQGESTGTPPLAEEPAPEIVAEEVLPVPPVPVPPPAAVAERRVMPPRPAEPPRPALADMAPPRPVAPPETRAAAAPRSVVAAPAVQPVAARVPHPAAPSAPVSQPAVVRSAPVQPAMVQPVVAQRVSAPRSIAAPAAPVPAYGGSLLGMARGGNVPAPLPQPMPTYAYPTMGN
jgi:hypothetical protein